MDETAEIIQQFKQNFLEMVNELIEFILETFEDSATFTKDLRRFASIQTSRMMDNSTSAVVDIIVTVESFIIAVIAKIGGKIEDYASDLGRVFVSTLRKVGVHKSPEIALKKLEVMQDMALKNLRSVANFSNSQLRSAKNTFDTIHKMVASKIDTFTEASFETNLKIATIGAVFTINRIIIPIAFAIFLNVLAVILYEKYKDKKEAAFYDGMTDSEYKKNWSTFEKKEKSRIARLKR